ncbi:MAG: sugar-transfer associated ATP-grasp domain-containing protein, partial [Bacteroidota bacterium]
MVSYLHKIRAIARSAMGMNRRNIELIYPNNQVKDYKLADDKLMTKAVLEQYDLACAKTYAAIESIGGIHTAWESVQGYSKLAIKPANGRGGGGIKILKKNPQGQWMSSGQPISDTQIFKHFADIIMGVYSLGSRDRVLIEYCIEPHPFFHEIYPAGVPDFRVILLKHRPIMAMLRLPTDRSDGKANLHQGGLGIGIDLDTGTLQQAYDGQAYYDVHPDTQQPIKDRPIPHWDAIVTLSIQTAKAFPLAYLGIDIVIDKSLGPLVMEINVRPGLGIQLANQKGLREVFKLILMKVQQSIIPFLVLLLLLVIGIPLAGYLLESQAERTAIEIPVEAPAPSTA